MKANFSHTHSHTNSLPILLFTLKKQQQQQLIEEWIPNTLKTYTIITFIMLNHQKMTVNLSFNFVRHTETQTRTENNY